MYKMKVQELVKELLSDNAEDSTLRTLCNQMTRMPSKQVEEINECINLLLPTATSFSESYLICNCISKWLRGQNQAEFMTKEGHKCTKIDDCLVKLNGFLKIVVVHHEVNEKMKTAKEKKDQSGNCNKVGSGSRSENK